MNSLHYCRYQKSNFLLKWHGIISFNNKIKINGNIITEIVSHCMYNQIDLHYIVHHIFCHEWYGNREKIWLFCVIKPLPGTRFVQPKKIIINPYLPDIFSHHIKGVLVIFDRIKVIFFALKVNIMAYSLVYEIL